MRVSTNEFTGGRRRGQSHPILGASVRLELNNVPVLSVFLELKCTWIEKMVQDTGDGLFDKFMEAGAARVQVPVAQGFEDYVLYWEKTGQIWGPGGDPPLSDTDSHWISMVEEIKHQQDCYLNDR